MALLAVAALLFCPCPLSARSPEDVHPSPVPADSASAESSSAESASAEPTRLVLDFEDGDLVGWRPRPGDESFIEFDLSDDIPLSGERALICRVAGWDSAKTGNEQVVLRCEFAEPIPLDKPTEISWLWWVGDRDENDGVGIRLQYRVPWDSTSRDIEWASHSNRERGRWPFDDPAEQICRHSVTLGPGFWEEGDWRNVSAPLPCLVTGLELYFWFPQNQTAYFDEIRIGAPTEEAGEAVRGPLATPLLPKVTSILVADLDADGRADRIIGCADEPPLIWLGDRLESLTPLQAAKLGLGSATSLTHPTAADLDGDGRLDLLGFGANRFVMFRGLGAAHFAERPAPDPGDLQTNPVAGLLVADVLPEEGPELLVHRVDGMKGDLIYFAAGGDARVARSFPQPDDYRPRLGYRNCVRAADIDNDHDLDLFCANTDVFLQDQRDLVSGTTTWVPEIGTRQSGAVFGDIDNDGDLDLFISVDCANQEGLPHVTHTRSILYRNAGDRFIDISRMLGDGVSGHAHNPIFEDFDLDGDLDLFFTQQRWKPGPRLPNVYLVNDGSGRFTPGDPGSWITRTPPAGSVISFDDDDDGDPDLLLTHQADGNLFRVENPIEGRAAIKVRVLDRHGAPHAAGAQLALRESGNLVGYRQTGAGTLHGGWSEAIFGCVSAGPFELTVTFPAHPRSPVIRKDLRPGARLVIIEPAAGGPFGSWVARAEVGWRRFVDALASSGWPALLPIALLYGFLLGWVLSGRIGKAGATPRRGILPARALPRRSILAAAVAPLGLVAAAFPFWPLYSKAVTGGSLALAGLALGALAGLTISRVRGYRRQASRGSIDAQQVLVKLLDEIDGFSHADWLKYLSGIAALSKSLTDGANVDLVRPRLEKRLRSYDEVIKPQMVRIADTLARSGLDDALARDFRMDLATIDECVRTAQRGILEESDEGIGFRPDHGLQTALLRLSDGVRGTHEKIDRIFHLVGERFRTEVPLEIRAAVDRVLARTNGVEVETDIPHDLPPVFATRGDLSNIMENVITNAVKAARENAHNRPPRVAIRARVEGGLLILNVTDSGSGIPSDKLEAVFTFRTTDPRWHGRGLSYAKRRLKLFDGKIDVIASSAQTGTEVAVTLRTLGAGKDTVSEIRSRRRGRDTGTWGGRTMKEKR